MWPSPADTQELLARARDGQADAVNQLLARHREALRRMIDLRMDRMIQRRVDASDIVQEVLVEANRRLDEYLHSKEPVMPFHLWLRHMARDRLIDAHRRHRRAARRSIDRELPFVARTPQSGDEAGATAQPSPGPSPPLPVSLPPASLSPCLPVSPSPRIAAGSSFDLMAQLADPEPTPQAQAMWHELERRFATALSTLDELDQEVILMRHFEQLSNSEVAQALNLSDAASGMRYLRAMRRLRAKLDEKAEGEGSGE
jgi:RNA polymerase sigma-70 factor (ECF subfamily)